MIDNEASVGIARFAHAEFGEFVDVVTIGRNTGSAGGVKSRMQRGLDLGAEFVMLLNDDNELQPGCRAALSAVHQESAATVLLANLAILAYRFERQTDVAANVLASGMMGTRAAFFGFPLLDVPFKLFRRTLYGTA